MFPERACIVVPGLDARADVSSLRDDRSAKNRLRVGHSMVECLSQYKMKDVFRSAGFKSLRNRTFADRGVVFEDC
jgi:hypothetical protein